MNGMMSAPAAAAVPPAQAGMMSEPPIDPQQAQRFNGTVQSDQGPIEVKNGQATVDGQLFFVSDDGKYVANQKGGLVAIIQDGKVMQATPEIVDQLRQQGIVK